MIPPGQSPLADAPDPPTGSAHSTRVTVDDLYRRSTQYRLWSYRKQTLDKLRMELNAIGAELTAENIAAVVRKADPSLTFSPLAVQPLTPEEENAIVTYYARKIPGVGNFFKMNSHIKATGIAYFRRFYLVNSVMEFHPKLVLHTCLYLASKAENYFISIASYSRAIPKSTPESLLKYEFAISTALQFSLMCHHPYKAMYGFYLDLQTYIPEVDRARLNRCYDKAKLVASELLFSDTQFLFSPPHIALTCLWEADNELITKYLRRKYEGQAVRKAEASMGDADVPLGREAPNAAVPIGISSADGAPVEAVPAQTGEAEAAREGGDVTIKIETDPSRAEMPVVGTRDEDFKMEDLQETLVSPLKLEGADQDVSTIEPEKEQAHETLVLPKERTVDLNDLRRIIKQCSTIIKRALNPSLEEARNIDRKLYYCMHPEKTIERSPSAGA